MDCTLKGQEDALHTQLAKSFEAIIVQGTTCDCEAFAMSQ